MIYFATDKIDIPALHDACLIFDLKGWNWRDCYVDPCGEVAIKFDGRLTNSQIQEVIANLTPGDISINEIEPIQCKDFDYEINPEDGTYCTLVYSPDGYDYLENVWK